MSGFSLIKSGVLLFIIAIATGSLTVWYETVIVGNYFASAGVFLSILAAAAPVIILITLYYAIRYIVKLKPSAFDQ